MALQEATVYQPDSVLLYALEHEEDGYFIASRESVFNWTRIRPQNAKWFFVDKESNLWMQDEEGEYIQSRDPVTSFPTPKLGAKSREYVVPQVAARIVTTPSIRWKIRVTNDGILQTVWKTEERVNEIIGELTASDNGEWQVRITNDGLLQTALNQTMADLIAPDGGVWRLSVTTDGLIQTTKL